MKILFNFQISIALEKRNNLIEISLDQLKNISLIYQFTFLINCKMDFLSFRDQIYDWTLDSDQKLFTQVNKLTEHIFQTQKAINQSVVITKANLNESSTILNNNFNHFLRLSETKFTQNKIAESKRPLQSENAKPQQSIAAEPKTKMDIFKQALNISLKTLQIKQEEKQTDNVSVSQMSLSQAIFKNARLPPYFGSKQFRAQKFLNLFFDEDLQESVYNKKQIDNLSNQPLSTPSQTVTENSSFSNLAPPPSLDTLNLGGNNSNFSSGSLLPPPPPLLLNGLNLPPPPPLSSILLPPPPLPPALNFPGISRFGSSIGVPNMLPPSSSLIDQKDENKALLQSILLSTKNANNTSQNRVSFIQQPSLSQEQLRNKQPYDQPRYQEAPKLIQNKPLSFQQELALKLKFGKEYKPPAKVNQQQNIRYQENQQTSSRQPQPAIERANSFMQSAKIQEIIGAANTSKPQPKQSGNTFQNDEEQEEENALFGSSKRRNTAQNSAIASQNAKNVNDKNQADLMMSRSTFNEDMLFKKKPIFAKQSVLPVKPQQKTQDKPNRASVLFNQDSDEQDADFTFKKKTKKASKVEQKSVEQQSPKKKLQQKKSNPLGLSPKTQTLPKTAQQPKKKPVNKLFGGDSDQQEEIFAKKKPFVKKQSQNTTKDQQIPVKVEQKAQPKVAQVPKKVQKVQQRKKKPVNKLFGGDSDQQEDIFSKKKVVNKKQSQTSAKSIESPIKVPQNIEKKTLLQNKTSNNPLGPTSKPVAKKNSLFQEDEQNEDFSFQSKSKVGKKQIQKQAQQQEQVKKLPIKKQPDTISVKKQESKIKNSLFSIIHQQQNEQSSMMIASPKQKAKQQQTQILKQEVPIQIENHVIQDKIQEEESEQAKRMKRIARMGGQPMMGMAQIMPKGMVITKPSETKQQEKIARQNIQIETKHEVKANTSPVLQNIIQTQKSASFQRPLDPLQRLISQIMKPKEQITQLDSHKQTQKAYSQKKLDPLQLLIKQQIINKRPLHQKDQPTIKQEGKTQNADNSGLSLRRKKNKSKRNTEDVFDQQAEQKLKKPIVVNSFQSANKIQKTQEPKEKKQGQKITKINPLLQQTSQTGVQKQSYIQKMSRMGMAGMAMPGMMMPGLGPLMPKGMIITKPSQAKRLQQQALQRIKHENQQKKLLQRQNQEKQLMQKILYEQQQALQRAIQEQNQTKNLLEQQEREIKQRKDDQLEQLRRIQHEREKKRLFDQNQQRQKQEELYRQQQNQKRLAQEEMKRLQEKQKIQAQLIQAEKKQKSTLPNLPALDMGNKKENPLAAKTKNPIPLNMPVMPSKAGPLGGGLSKSPLGGPLSGPLVGKAPKTTGLLSNSGLSVPQMPSIGREVQKNAGKKSLFDDEEEIIVVKKKETMLPHQVPALKASENKKGSLFDDDEDESGFGLKSKTKKTVSTAKRGLFDEDDDQELGFGKKEKKSQPRETNEPIIHQKVNLQSRNPPPKKSLLNNDSDEDNGSLFGKRKQTVKPPIASFKVKQDVRIKSPSPQSKIAQKPKPKKGLFGDSDSQQDSGFGKKKTVTKAVEQKKAAINNFEQKPTKAPATQAKQQKNKKGLFNQSQQQEDDPFKKKPANKVQVPKAVTKNVASNNQSSLPAKKIQNNSISPLSMPSSKVNPLGGSNASKIIPEVVSQPKNQSSGDKSSLAVNKPNPITQKKRNIFEQSEQQSQSPIIPSTSRAKIGQQQQPPQQKKGLILQDSQQQKLVRKQQKVINVMPVKQQEQPRASQANNSRRLFDDSQDSDDQQMNQKKRAAANKLKKIF